ncbi:MAG: hypothetical protein ACE5HZ_01595 [Fidelibacterota bacterium]
MAALKDTLETITGWLKDIVNFGLALVLVFLVVDILFAGYTGIVGNLASFVDSFVQEGVVGWIILIAIVAIYRS